MAVPVIYAGGSSNLNPSFDYFDLATGQAYKRFYAGDVSGAMILSTNQFYSLVGYTSAPKLGAKDIDFDITFNRTVIVEGQVLVNVPVQHYNDHTSSATIESTTTATFVHFDGSTQTLVASGAAYITGLVLTNETRADNFTIAVDVPRTTFKTTDTLRLNIRNVPENTGFGGITLGHDPANRTDLQALTWLNSQLTTDIPFKIQEI